MFHLAIVDDDKRYMELTCAMVMRYAEENKSKQIVFNSFRSSLELLEAVERGEEFDALLINIVMPGINGISAAMELRNMGIRSPVIFVTEDRAIASDAMKAGSTHFLLRGFLYEELRKTLDSVADQGGKERRRHMVMSTMEGYRHIYLRNILYCVADGKYQDVFMDNGEKLEVRMSHKALAAKLEEGPNFISVGSSFIVNLFYISELNVDHIIMEDRYLIQIPGRLHKTVRRAYEDFMLSRGSRNKK